MGFNYYFLKLKYFILYYLYSFDPWHYKVIYYSNNYFKCVVDLANSLQVDNVCEIGVGLGNIIARISAKNKLGLDIDKKVVKASKFLNKNIPLIVGDFLSLINLNKKFDLVICVNFIHNIPSTELYQHFNQLNTRYIICDQIVFGTKNYKFSHSFLSNDLNYNIKLVINQKDQFFRNILK